VLLVHSTEVDLLHVLESLNNVQQIEWRTYLRMDCDRVPEVLSLCIGLDQLRLVDYPFENVPH